jgi:hypothetical protein
VPVEQHAQALALQLARLVADLVRVARQEVQRRKRAASVGLPSSPGPHSGAATIRRETQLSIAHRLLRLWAANHQRMTPPARRSGHSLTGTGSIG